MLCISMMAQTVTLKFTGRDADNQWVQLDRVTISNQTKGWTETLQWPDTVLMMQNGTGIYNVETMCTSSLQLFQNQPNPFNGTTNINLTVAGAGAVTLEITDVNGRTIVETTHALSPQAAGTHQFRITLSAAGTYVMTARQNGETSSIKMVNTGGGNGDRVEYVGGIAETTHALSPQALSPHALSPHALSPQPKPQTRDLTTQPFNFGDRMEYVGYATINGAEQESHCITQTQDSSQFFELQFTETQGQEYGQPCPGMPTLTDIDGNTYNTVWIGNQCWMKENLRTTHYADNTEIPVGSTFSNTDPYRYIPDNVEGNVRIYGYLYNWTAVMHGDSSSSATPSGVQGICPDGWHVPSDGEWNQLTDYVSDQSEYVCDGDNTHIAKALSGKTGWNSDTTTCAIGNTLSSNNATGFGALPAGKYLNGYDSFGDRTFFWSTTESGRYSAYNHGLGSDYAIVVRNFYYKESGFSVRCVRD